MNTRAFFIPQPYFEAFLINLWPQMSAMMENNQIVSWLDNIDDEGGNLYLRGLNDDIEIVFEVLTSAIDEYLVANTIE